VDLARLLHPRTVAVVGATDHGDKYGSQTLVNLRTARFGGEVWGVNPNRESAHGFPCVPTLADLPSVPDAVVIATPAPTVPGLVDEAGAMGCGGAVVFAAGFREGANRSASVEAPAVPSAAASSAATLAPPAGATLEAELRAAALRHAFPVCGPNCDGLVALHSRAALWGDALKPVEPGHVGLISQSGNLVVNALATRRGLRLHTAISSGNETVVSTADWLAHLATEPEMRSVALLVEDAGDGAALCEALAACADAGIGVAVLKVGASAVGAAAAAAHTAALAGDQRVFRALAREAGAAWADDVHDLLELAKALAVRGARPRGRGLGILTCSGGDSGLGADEAERLGIELPAFAPATAAALEERLPPTATIANPLDYTAVIWGDRDWERVVVALVGDDPNVDQVLVFYDHPPGLEGALGQSWQAVEDGIVDGAHASPVPVMVAATLPELLDDTAAARFGDAGVPAVGGLRTGLACAAALQAPPPDPARLRAMAAAANPQPTSRGLTPTTGGRWLAEHEAKDLLRPTVPVVEGRVVVGEEDAVSALGELGGLVAVKASHPQIRHKAAVGAVRIDLAAEPAVRAAFRDFSPRGAVLVERMAPPGAELIVSVRRDAVVPALVIGLGGGYAGVLDDVAIVPLPADPARVEHAIRQLKGAALLGTADLPAAARLATRLTELHGLELIECNPVLVHNEGAVVVDAIAKEISS
jgi:acyl-CoA synthetase (NDP forming)